MLVPRLGSQPLAASSGAGASLKLGVGLALRVGLCVGLQWVGWELSRTHLDLGAASHGLGDTRPLPRF